MMGIHWSPVAKITDPLSCIIKMIKKFMKDYQAQSKNELVLCWVEHSYIYVQPMTSRQSQRIITKYPYYIIGVYAMTISCKYIGADVMQMKVGAMQAEHHD